MNKNDYTEEELQWISKAKNNIHILLNAPYKITNNYDIGANHYTQYR